MIPITYYPVATQHTLEQNRARLAGKPYAHYFDPQMYVRDEVLPALQQPMDVRHALTTSPADLNRLLEPGHHAVETGYCEMPDGSAYTASLTHFPGCTPDMLAWWMWWHSVEPERYVLWFPWCHVSVKRNDLAQALAPGLSHEQRYIGSKHIITEYIGSEKMRIVIDFVDPKELGMDTARFAEAGIVAHACGHVSFQFPPMRVATMVHLVRATADGFELRSRYWMADHVALKFPGFSLPIDGLANLFHSKRHFAGARLAYEQLLHDQSEFTHLAGFLAQIHAEFGGEPGHAGRTQTAAE
jgi:2,4-diacetylphloroglucinol hydrolase